MILYQTADLFWATRIKGTAEMLGIPARPVRTLEMLQARLQDSEVRALVVDLDAPEVAIPLIHRMRGEAATPTERGVYVVAFGPHVATDAFAAARSAGADKVLARGAFATHLAEWLRLLDTVSGLQGPASSALPITE